MNREETKTHFETLSQDAGLEVTEKLINKLVNLALEVARDEIDDVEEIKTELATLIPEKNDEWLDFIDEAASYVMDQILEDQCSEETEETD